MEQLAHYIAQELGKGVPESTLRTSLKQRGWTDDWIAAGFRAARQSVNPGLIPDALLPQPGMVSPAPATQPLQIQPQPRPLPAPRSDDEIIHQPYVNRKKAFIKLGIIGLVLVTIAVGAYLVLTMLKNAETQRQLRDAARKQDLSVLLSDLSDYYVAHNSYPTREELGDAAFQKNNGFASESLVDPGWSADNSTCVKDGKPSLVASPAPGCYGYQAISSEGAVCDNKENPCKRMRVTMTLEKEKEPYKVTFDQNSEIEE